MLELIRCGLLIHSHIWDAILLSWLLISIHICMCACVREKMNLQRSSQSYLDNKSFFACIMQSFSKLHLGLFQSALMNLFSWKYNYVDVYGKSKTKRDNWELS